ncbi:hypothetical protein [Verrucomicrobium spinosum]|uniref:hypothetical protein n=1 Tax=Verrucomicrobium spinosum TaxID=2736 RepID=UPI000174497B|nr:hypothetical protein [Verrucomicrobium spinosum]
MRPLSSLFQPPHLPALCRVAALVVSLSAPSLALRAQTPAPAPAPAPAPVSAPAVAPAAAAASASPSLQSRLETLDATYKSNLRRLHAPVLQDYMRQLELLRQQLGARARLSDAKTVEKEIEQVKQLISNGGAMPYTALQPAPPVASGTPVAAVPAPPPPPGPPGPGPGMSKRPSLVLHPNMAKVQGVPTDPSAKTLSLGVAEWSVPSLPAGSYDLSIVFSAAKLDNDAEIRAFFNGNDLTATLSADRATGSDQTFRIFRIGHITLAQDVTNEVLQMRSNLPLGQMQVKNVIFAEPRKVKE